MSWHFLYILFKQGYDSFDQFTIKLSDLLTVFLNFCHDLRFLPRLRLQFLRQFVNTFKINAVSSIFEYLQYVGKKAFDAITSGQSLSNKGDCTFPNFFRSIIETFDNIFEAHEHDLLAKLRVLGLSTDYIDQSAKGLLPSLSFRLLKTVYQTTSLTQQFLNYHESTWSCCKATSVIV